MAHPKLLFDSTELTALRALKATTGFKAIYDWLDDTFDYLYTNEDWENYVFGAGSYEQAESYIGNGAAAYALTEDSRYLDMLLAWYPKVLALASWGNPASGQEVVASIATSMCFCYDVIYNDLTAGERTAMRDGILAQLAPFYTVWNADFPSPWNAPSAGLQCYPNTCSMMVGAFGVAGVCFAGETGDGVPAAYQAWAEGAGTWYLTLGGNDGSWFEGTEYANYMRFAAMYWDATRRNGGTDFFTGNTFLTNLGLYYVYCGFNDTLLPIEDHNYEDPYRICTSTPITMLLAKEYSNGYVQYFADNAQSKMIDKSFSFPKGYAYFWRSTTNTPTAPTTLSTYKYFTAVGTVFYRTGWTDADYIFTFKCSHAKGHSHSDQNAWSLFGNVSASQATISGNPGYCGVGVFDNSKQYNTVLSKQFGQAQPLGDDYGTAAAPVTNTATMEAVTEATDFIYMRGNAADVYVDHEETGGTAVVNYNRSSGDLSKFVRHIVLMKDPFYFIIFDDITAPGSERIDWLWQGNGGQFSTPFGGLMQLYQYGKTLTLLVERPNQIGYVVVSDAAQSFEPPYASATVVGTDKQFLALGYLSYPGTRNIIEQGNCLGYKIATDATHIDLVLFSTDGNAVNQWVNLGDYYAADDGGSYNFSNMQIQVSFSTYAVIRLVQSESPIPEIPGAVGYYPLSSNLIGSMGG